MRIFALLSLLVLAGFPCVPFEDWSGRTITYQVINLARATDRKAKMQQQFDVATPANASTPKLSLKFVDAVLGADLNPQDLISKGTLDPDAFKNGVFNPGQMGNYLSHLAAIKNAAANSGTITVTFEDDVIVPYDIDIQFREALKQVPADWDILYLGCNQDSLAKSVAGGIIDPYTPPATVSNPTLQFPLCHLDEKYRVSGTAWIQLDSGCVAGLYAYSLRPSSANKLAQLLLPMRDHTDQAVRKLIGRGDIIAYCLYPELVRANNTIPSTIRNIP